MLNGIAELSFPILCAFHVHHNKSKQLHGSAVLVNVGLKYWSSDLP